MTEPWYEDGLRFSCTRCGACCTGEPGFVWASDDELEAIAAFRDVPVEELIAMHTRVTHRGRTLREKPNGDCVFFEREAGCTIYSVRPSQCRTWPFWPSNVRTADAWKRTQEICPGAGKGDLVTVEEITQRIRAIDL